MKLSRKQQWTTFAIVNGTCLLALFGFPLYVKLMSLLPDSRCSMLKYFHLYCPGCGGTRAFFALIHFDIISSFMYNPVVPIGALILILYEGIMIKYLIQKKARPFLLKPWMAYVFIGLWLTYSIVRNVLLFFGIDMLGNIL